MCEILLLKENENLQTCVIYILNYKRAKTITISYVEANKDSKCPTYSEVYFRIQRDRRTDAKSKAENVYVSMRLRNDSVCGSVSSHVLS